MDSRNVVAVPALSDRYRMKVELVREHCLCFVTPFRNVKPEESVGASSQVWQLGQVVVAHAIGLNPAQLHGLPPFKIVSTPRHQESPLRERAMGAEEQP
jgi:hypothetical protein